MYLRGKALGHFVHSNQSLWVRRTRSQYTMWEQSPSKCGDGHARYSTRYSIVQRFAASTQQSIMQASLEIVHLNLEQKYSHRTRVCMYTSLVFLYQCVSLARVILHTARLVHKTIRTFVDYTPPALISIPLFAFSVAAHNKQNVNQINNRSRLLTNIQLSRHLLSLFFILITFRTTLKTIDGSASYYNLLRLFVQYCSSTVRTTCEIFSRNQFLYNTCFTRLVISPISLHLFLSRHLKYDFKFSRADQNAPHTSSSLTRLTTIAIQ